MRRLTTLLAALAAAVTLLSGRVQAQTPGHVALTQFSLPNGLHVILDEDHTAQVVAVDVWYHVGSRNERRGRSGFAHLFEHMMFEGSAHVKKDQYMKFIQSAGGRDNANTTEDHTGFYEVLPSNRLNLGLWLEADRMRSLAITDSTFHNQRETVKEERRLRVDNQPYAAALFVDDYALFDSATCFPYSHSVIGSMDDLNAATVEDVRAFHAQYYAPNNATLVLVGDFTPANAKRLVTQYFGDVPRASDPPPVVCHQAFDTGAMHRAVSDPKATLPATVHAFRIPAYDNRDTPALTLLATILGQGESSRLNRTLARQDKAAVAAQALTNPFGPRRGPGVFIILAIANQGVKVDSLDQLLTAQLASIATGGVTEAELTKAKNAHRAGAIFERQEALSMAEALQSAALFLGSPDAINTDLARYDAVTVADIKRVAATYLRPDNSLTLIITPEAGK
ncbi:MAG TPA: pitrilysin family protein [Gemmatimonadaceae bacterium]|nr:pitrilysin family protein [Gemmatimonadaceae bacterium]